MALTKEQKEARLRQLRIWYDKIIGTSVKMPERLRREFLANDGAWDYERALLWIRLNDDEWLKTEQASNRMAKLKQLYRNVYGPMTKFTSKHMVDQLHAFARANPRRDMNEVLIRIFKHDIMNNKQFAKVVPGGKATFMAWLKKQPVSMDILSATAELSYRMQQYRQAWDNAMTGKPMPKSIIIKALENDWTADSVPFTNAIVNSAEYAGSQSYDSRVKDFTRNWEAIFGSTVPPNQALMDKYARMAVGWDEYFQTDIKSSKDFTIRFPDYVTWERNRHRGMTDSGYGEGAVDINDYFRKRSELVEAWQAEYTENQAIDQELLSKAMKENWSITQWQNAIRRLPQFASTSQGKTKGEQFDQYWAGLFGDLAPVNTELRGEYMFSDFTDPSAMWDKIKATQQFQQVYRNWDAFAQAQANTGVNVTQDPMQYQEYQNAFKKAFEEIGLVMPEGMDKQIFASGLTPNDIEDRTQLYKQTAEAFELQTGQKVGVADVMGLKGGLKGGDLRLRLQKALEAQRAYNRSKFSGVKSRTSQAGFVTQKI